MTQTTCLYCQKRLVPNAIDGTQPSIEHIVPWALGGSNGCTTRDCCNTCNTTLGDTVDAEFINSTIMAMFRSTYGIEGHGGAVPDVRVPARSLATSEPGEIRFKRDRTVDVRHEPVVVRQPMGAVGEELLIAGEPDQARKIAEGIIASVKRKGGQVWTKSGKPVTNVDELMAEAERTSSSEYMGGFEIDLTVQMRGNAKIAFGLGYVLLGASWSTRPAADRLRVAARGLGDFDADVRPIVKGADPKLRQIVVGKEPDDARTHIVAILPGSELKIMVSLFGGKALAYVFDAGALQLPEEEGLFGRCGVEIDPVTRSARWFGLRDLAVSAGFRPV